VANRIEVRESAAADEAAVRQFLAEHASEGVARLGTLVQPADHPALVALRGGVLRGVLTYLVDGSNCEILTLHVAEQWGGTGTALVAAAERTASNRGCRRLWVLTTNDNVDALRFYQRRGFRLTQLHAGAVDEARARLKPEIPRVGDHGIPLRDELVLEKEVG
jgi:GNAT superfamily N-acetyltransferase